MNPEIKSHIESSGISVEYLQARQAEAVELAAVGVGPESKGYVIPYFDIYGKRLPFYRVRLLQGEPKYKQPKSTLNHIYFPKEFLTCADKSPFVVITEGERKAAAATYNGIPTVGLGGVDSWKSRKIIVDKEAKFKPVNFGKQVEIKLPAGSDGSSISEGFEVVAEGFGDFVDYVVRNKKKVVIIFDSDSSEGLKLPVRRAAWSLGQALRSRGVSTADLKLLVLPTNGQGKMGLDDFIIAYGAKNLRMRIEAVLEDRTAFPKHPTPRVYINNKLNKGQLSRAEVQEVAGTIIAELDGRGIRLRTKAVGQPYFFDIKSRKLIPATLFNRDAGPLHELPFGSFLYSEFGISSADSKLLTWLAAQFTGEEPVEEVEPRRVLAFMKDGSIAHQLSDSEFISIGPEHIKIHHNGSGGLLFEHDQVRAVDNDLLMKELERQKDLPIHPYWLDVLHTMNVTTKHGPELATLLFYLAPWLNRWRGTQLPVELVTGAAGSGKSSLYMLRLNILTGTPLLRNIPQDLKDWHAGITSTGGLYVIDNVQFTNKELKQRISDEICRIITEPFPHVEMRKLYTTSTQVSLPVTTTFAFTAIEQPFHNSDLIQRSAMLEFGSVGVGLVDSNWTQHQIERLGSREAWLAHHYLVLQAFMQKAHKQWNYEKNATHRLANYEQCLEIMGEVLGIPTGWLVKTLVGTMLDAISDADWTMQGLNEFGAQLRMAGKPNATFTAKDIYHWAIGQEEFENNPILNNSRKLGKYMTKNQAMIQRICGIIKAGSTGNSQTYRLVAVKESQGV